MIPDIQDKKNFWNPVGDFFLLNSHFGTFVHLCINFKNFFHQMTFFLSIMRDILHTLAKKYLRLCSGQSVYLFKRINWIISSFPHRISKILFGLGSWDAFGSLGCTRIVECSFFNALILFLGSAQWCVFYKLKKLKTDMRFENIFKKFKCF